MRNKCFYRMSLAILLSCATLVSGLTQDDVNYLASNLKVTYSVLDNLVDGFATFEGQFKFQILGERNVSDNSWVIHWNSLRMMEYKTLLQGPNNYPSKDGAPIGNENSGLRVYHENGNLFKIKPTAQFKGFEPGAELTIPWISQNWEVARSDIFPYWFVDGRGLEARTIENTASENIEFSTAFDNENKWKRYDSDMYDPYTPEQRFDLQDGRAEYKPTTMIQTANVVPTPQNVSLSTEETIDLGTGEWIVIADENLDNEANFLADQLETVVQRPSDAPTSHVIHIQTGDSSLTDPEEYIITISSDPALIQINGSKAGVFYGCQTLLGLLDGSRKIPTGTIHDSPRFPYRGMHVDVARNFQNKDTILELLEIMGRYKMNKFHFHLTDDEGWRLEIPGLPELIEVGSRRCYSPEQDACIIPQFGSGPGLGTSGTGHYSVQDYKDILEYAEKRHIEVIPEFDMPGHGHAAIKAMQARYNKYMDSNMTAAMEYLLTDFNDTSEYVSVQMFTDNAIDPCRTSSYAFIEHVVDEVIEMHHGVQDLKVFHFGGDEVPALAWTNSTLCQDPPPGVENVTDLKAAWKEYFVKRIASYTANKGLNLGAWEDGLMSGSYETFNRSSFENNEVYAMAWDNIWEWGRGSRAYILANNGYKTVLSHATHLYFDHPQEPDPEERGFYWASRFADCFKTFGYMPERVYDNIDVNRAGKAITKQEICEDFECENLTMKENIAGIQGQLWSETVRMKSHLHDMIFPRFIGLAERAWHKASWEDIEDETEREKERMKDWERFANLLGQKELVSFDNRQIEYNIPPPGIKLTTSNEATANSAFPGLPIQYSTDNGMTWTDYNTPVQLPEKTNVQFVVKSPNRARSSRVVEVTTTSEAVTDGATCVELTISLIIGIQIVTLILYQFIN